MGGVAHRSFVDRNQCFRGKYCLRLQGVLLPFPSFFSADCSTKFLTKISTCPQIQNVTTHKLVIAVVTFMKTAIP